MSACAVLAVVLAFGGGVAGTAWILRRTQGCSGRREADHDEPAPPETSTHGPTSTDAPDSSKLPLPAWVATLQDQLRASAEGNPVEPHSLGDPLPALQAAAAETADSLPGRSIAILAHDAETAVQVRRYLIGIEDLEVTIVESARDLAPDGPQPDIDVLLVEPERVAEIPFTLVCPIVPIRATTRRARLLDDLRHALRERVSAGAGADD